MQSVRTSRFTFLFSASTVWISRATCLISFSFMPRVVRAGVPRRMPDGSAVHIYIITKKSGSCSYSLPKPETETRGSRDAGAIEVPNVPNPKVSPLAGDSETPDLTEVAAEPAPARAPTLAAPTAIRDAAAVAELDHH